MHRAIKYFSIVACALVLAALTACSTTPVCLTASTTPLEGKQITENLGLTEGTDDTSVTILFMWMIGRPSLDDAIIQALIRKGGNALINVRCYQVEWNFILFQLTYIRVVGDAVTLAPAGEKNEKKPQY
jgi:hypothetical protein